MHQAGKAKVLQCIEKGCLPLTCETVCYRIMPTELMVEPKRSNKCRRGPLKMSPPPLHLAVHFIKHVNDSRPLLMLQ